MEAFRAALFAPLALLAATAPASASEIPPPTQILVDMHDATTDGDERALEERLGGGIDLVLNSVHARGERFFVADVDPAEIPAYLERIIGDPRVEHAEPNYMYGLPYDDVREPDLADGSAPTRGPTAPNDPRWDAQWSLRMIDTPSAWLYADGSGVIVAVIDTGVAYENHKGFRRVEDLAKTEFVPGYDFVSDTEHPNDDHGHGTHVSGTIAQSTNNKVGVAGVAYGARIMPLKVLNKRGFGSAADIADAIRYAADEGARVINLSLGGGMRSLVMESAVKYARKKGVVVVCAAGNGGRAKVEFPAAYEGAFAVSSVGPDRQLAFYSSYGKELALAAPGGDKVKGGEPGGILQNTIQPDKVGATDLYLFFQGTSMAAPHVAGVAALVISAGVTDAGEVERILRETAEPAASADAARYGAGVVHAGRAAKAARERAGGGWHLFLALAGAAAIGLRARRRHGLGLGPAGVLGAILGSSGLYFLSGFGLERVPGLSLLLRALPQWDHAWLGASWHFTAIWASAAPVVGLAILGLGLPRLHRALAGLALGWAAHLAVSGVFMPADVQWVPGAASILDRLWLFANAALLVGLASLFLRIAALRRPR